MSYENPIDYRKKEYNQSTPIPAKFLMPDGSVSDTLPGGGGGGGSTSWNQVYSKPFNTISTDDFKVESNQLKLKNPGGSVMDNALSTTSENGVQNKVITSALNRKQNVLTAGTGVNIDNTDQNNPRISANVDYTNLINKPTKLSDFTNDQNFVDNTVNNLTNYYLKTQTYTQEEVNNLISHLASLTVEIVETLPTEDISTSTIYLINVTGTTNYEQWMYINSAWSNIGNTSVDLSNYYTKSQADTLFNDKVDKVSGKGLSTNDFNDTYKGMLDDYEVDSELNSASTNPIQNGAVADALNLKQPKTLSAPIVVGGESSSTVETALGNINNLVNTKLPMVTSLPSSPSNGDTVLYTGNSSGGLVTGGIYQYQVSKWVLISSAGDDVYTKEETDEKLAVINKAINYNWQGNGYNLIPYPYYDGTSKETNGITFTVNSDGSVTANGTATANAIFYFIRADYRFESGKKYRLSGSPAGGGITTHEIQVSAGTEPYIYRDNGDGIVFTADSRTYAVLAVVRNGNTVSNLTFKPMITEVDENDNYPTEYQRYAYGNVKLSNFETYSTTETKIGTWIDGKPIYRKVIPIFENSQLVSGITPIAGSDYEYTGGMPSNIDKILNYNVPSLRNNYDPYVDNFTGMGVGPTVTFVPRLNGTFYFNPGYPENISPIWCYCIIEYTKTTD